jgi:hypothetical protein
MVEKGPTGGGQYRSLGAPVQELNPDLVFEIADLATERRLGCVKPLLGGKREAPGLGNRDEIAKVSKLHGRVLPKRYGPQLIKSFSNKLGAGHS